MRLAFSTTGFEAKEWEGEAAVARIRQQFQALPVDGFELVDEPASGEMIVLIESVAFKERNYARFLAGHPLIREHGDRCLVYNYEDHPIAFLPGAYVALSANQFDPKFHRACAYLEVHNRQCLEPLPDVKPAKLFGFRGNVTSHPVRSEIMKLGKNDAWRLESTGSWYNHSQDELARFVAGLLESKYVLCPRGLGPASHRLFESMAVGRAPVIISDSWVPPKGPDWDAFAIFVTEADVERLPAILGSIEGEWEDRGRLSRREWERWFGPETGLKTLLLALRELRHETRPGMEWLAKQWVKDSFYRPYGQGNAQKGLRKIRKLLGGKS
ncbi:MAG TPA: exostosin family protein [Fimbriimonadaceae bacterium]|nr:exostosin family protein [Fimbriimonadaceae bacterium]